MKKAVRFPGALMQSFTAMGPLLNFVALFSVIAFYSGALLPIVILSAFFLSFTTINTPYRFSKIFSTNGGYYSYSGIVLSKDIGIIVSLIYFFYGLFALPDIALFVSNFASIMFSALGYNIFSYRLLVALMFVFFVLIIVSTGLKISIKYTIIAGILEFMFILILSGLFFAHSTTSPSIITLPNTTNIDRFWLGMIFGILAFAGSSSPIFLSENTYNAKKITPYSIFVAYVLAGMVMFISSEALFVFVGAQSIHLYAQNPYIIFRTILTKYGIVLFIAFSIFTIISALNLSVAYLNALKNAYLKMHSDKIFILPTHIHNQFFIIIGLISVIIIYFSSRALGYFNSFVFLAGAVSLSYIVVHIISNIALTRFNLKIQHYKTFILPVISTIVLATSFVYYFSNFSVPFIYTDMLMLLLLILAVVYVWFLKLKRKEKYAKIVFNVDLK